MQCNVIILYHFAGGREEWHQRGQEELTQLFPGTSHPTAGTGERSTGEGAERRGTMELDDAQRNMLGMHGSKITDVAWLHQHLIVSGLFEIMFI